MTTESTQHAPLRALLAGASRLRAALAAGAERDRLDASVIRPLREALGGPVPPLEGAQGGPVDPPPDGALGGPVDSPPEAAPEVASPDSLLWELARKATALRVATGAPLELQEATAALQDLATRPPDSAAERHAELGALQAGVPRGIEIEPDGPYLATNAGRLLDWLGGPIPTLPQTALCRCGASELKPFCDGSHARTGFTDAKDPERVADRRDSYVGQQVTILDNRGTCQHSGFCTDRLATAFRLGEEPFVRPSGGRMDELVRAVRDCPSGALSYAVDGVEARDTVDFHGRRDEAITVSKDGPYRITGSIPLTDAAGEDVTRNEGASREHYALCRCGHSRNKPFCSGMHWSVEFRDPVPDPDHTPTLFEWCGGLPALTRMTRLFYEKHVPQDPMLAPLFAQMSADHPERVAKWLGEVFGGPPCYSGEYGGYPRMLSQHVGTCLTEEWRERWVSLLLRSAREAGLPNDAEFRSAFQAYIEWGSRLAVENSQTNARPPERMPMPRWDWSTGAGPPRGRVSALAAAPEEEEAPVVLPAADEPVRFEKHIKPLFRARDRDSMRFAFDLWSYDDVKEHADAILERVRNGSMPCDGAWPEERMDVFARWVASGRSG